jgi:hypothetical protein
MILKGFTSFGRPEFHDEAGRQWVFIEHLKGGRERWKVRVPRGQRTPPPTIYERIHLIPIGNIFPVRGGEVVASLFLPPSNKSGIVDLHDVYNTEHTLRTTQ